jgi:hypothetical protein
MTVRTERFNGMLGVYSPGHNMSGPRIVYVESELYFDSIQEGMAYLQDSAGYDWVYTSDGLAVGYRQVPERRQVSIALYQLYVDRDKPSSLPDSKDEAITFIEAGGMPAEDAESP